jgi:hypothetical protein
MVPLFILADVLETVPKEFAKGELLEGIAESGEMTSSSTGGGFATLGMERFSSSALIAEFAGPLLLGFRLPTFTV